MKNKKGFTLVELLAVIAILAILVIIALPNVLDMFNQAKIGTFVTEAQTVFKTAQQDYLLGNAVGGTFGNSDTCTSSVKKLNMTGNTKLKYRVKVNAEGLITRYQVYDSTYSYDSGDVATGLKIEQIVEGQVVDKSLPSAQLNGRQTYATVKTAVDGCAVN